MTNVINLADYKRDKSNKELRSKPVQPLDGYNKVIKESIDKLKEVVVKTYAIPKDSSKLDNENDRLKEERAEKNKQVMKDYNIK